MAGETDTRERERERERERRKKSCFDLLFVNVCSYIILH
jgi:hypothetical protein